MTILLFSALALAGDVVAVEAGQTVEISGPAVWMSEGAYREYVTSRRNLPVCREALDKAVEEGLAANGRTLEAWKLAREQFTSDERLIDEQVQTIASTGAKLDEAERARARLQQQRNVAWGVSLGFLSAATAAVALSLD